jgi:hypothetical protein
VAENLKLLSKVKSLLKKKEVKEKPTHKWPPGTAP